MLLGMKEEALAGLGAKARVLTKTERICEEDQAQHSLEEAISMRLNGLEFSQLKQIQEALDRLQLGDFGTCLACDERIPPKRLQAVPWARYCVECQERIADNPPEDEDELLERG